MSVLTFLAQLEEPPAAAYAAEEKALRRAAPGPGKWASCGDLWYLKECYGQTLGFHRLRTVALAAKVRVATCEPLSHRGLSLRRRARNLQECVSSTEHFDRLSRWSDWYKQSPLLVLTAAVNEFVRMGFSVASVQDSIAGRATEPWSEEVALKVKRRFQSAVTQKIHHHHRPNAEERVRAKLARWQLPGPSAHVARRALRRLQQLRSLVSPRVCAAVFSTMWNRWTTARRFQQRASAANSCVLGCGGGAEDSIEHYSRCQAVRACATNFLRLPVDSGDLPQFVFADEGLITDETLACRALLVYATYRVTNHYRSSRHCPCTEAAADALAQHCKNGVEGHAASRRMLDFRWLQAAQVEHSRGQGPKRRRTTRTTPPPPAPRSDAISGACAIGFVAGASLATGFGWQR